MIHHNTRFNFRERNVAETSTNRKGVFCRRRSCRWFESLQLHDVVNTARYPSHAPTPLSTVDHPLLRPATRHTHRPRCPRWITRYYGLLPVTRTDPAVHGGSPVITACYSSHAPTPLSTVDHPLLRPATRHTRLPRCPRWITRYYGLLPVTRTDPAVHGGSPVITACYQSHAPTPLSTVDRPLLRPATSHTRLPRCPRWIARYYGLLPVTRAYPTVHGGSTIICILINLAYDSLEKSPDF